MIRPWHTWIVFGVCLAVVLSAMGWISLTVLRLEALTNRQATLEENVRLALWRMESALGPIIASESVRPYFSYRPFYPSERAYTRMFNEIKPHEVPLPSPLLTFESPYILLHFQYRSGGELTSPQVPTGNMRDLAKASYTTDEKLETSAALLADLHSRVDAAVLLDTLPREAPQPVSSVVVRQPVQQVPVQRPAQQQKLRSVMEQNVRFQQLASNVLSNEGAGIFPVSSDVREGPIKALWMDDVLLLARRVSVNGEEYVQGCRLDWPAIRRWLANTVKDLLPEADLEAASPDPAADQTRMLAALPVRLIPGEVPVNSAQPVSPMQMSLLIAWVCVMLAAIAVVVLLVGAVSLSEHRAAFVSAVTHEMRTPLTTFRMYTEMLVKGMIPDEAKRRSYLATLHVESERLSHLVENVLAYARLEGNRTTDRTESVTLCELIDRVENRLSERAEQASMVLVTEADESALATSVRVDTSAVEQILFNLVDNACKYAASTSDHRIHLRADSKGKLAILQVRDHGPGISKADTRHPFRPFCKSARDAADSAPGVGLGLALSRRLARSMGGNLHLDKNTKDGACFVLELPRCVIF